MITVIYVGRHEVRLAEPGLVSLKLRDELLRTEANEILHIVREHLAKRDGRILIDVDKLGTIPYDWRNELELLIKEHDGKSTPARFIAFVRAHMLHKVIIAPLLSRCSTSPQVRLEARFFQGQDDALSWLQLSGAQLFASEESIYVTRVY